MVEKCLEMASMSKKPFLRKGEGIARFNYKPPKIRKPVNDQSMSQRLKSPDIKDNEIEIAEKEMGIGSKVCDQLGSLEAFEMLEEKASSASFCSTSSTVLNLVKQSIFDRSISTPNKAKPSELSSPLLSPIKMPDTDIHYDSVTDLKIQNVGNEFINKLVSKSLNVCSDFSQLEVLNAMIQKLTTVQLDKCDSDWETESETEILSEELNTQESENEWEDSKPEQKINDPRSSTIEYKNSLDDSLCDQPGDSNHNSFSLSSKYEPVKNICKPTTQDSRGYSETLNTSNELYTTPIVSDQDEIKSSQAHGEINNTSCLPIVNSSLDEESKHDSNISLIQNYSPSLEKTIQSSQSVKSSENSELGNRMNSIIKNVFKPNERIFKFAPAIKLKNNAEAHPKNYKPTLLPKKLLAKGKARRNRGEMKTDIKVNATIKVDNGCQTDEIGTSVIDDSIKNKILELEEEIMIFKKESMQLKKTRKSMEMQYDKLVLEQENFEKYKKSELIKIQEHCLKERRKLEEEKNVKLTKGSKPFLASQSEKAILEEKVRDLEKAIKAKDSTMALQRGRLQIRIQMLEEQIRKLKTDKENLVKEKNNLSVKFESLKCRRKTKGIHLLNEKMSEAMQRSEVIKVQHAEMKMPKSDPVITDVYPTRSLELTVDSTKSPSSEPLMTDLVTTQTAEPVNQIIGHHSPPSTIQPIQELSTLVNSTSIATCTSVSPSLALKSPISCVPPSPSMANPNQIDRNFISSESLIHDTENSTSGNSENNPISLNEPISVECNDKTLENDSTNCQIDIIDIQPKSYTENFETSNTCTVQENKYGVKVVQQDDGILHCYRKYCHRILYPNGDIEENFHDGKKQVYLASSQIKMIIYPNGEEVTEYSSGQVKHVFPDGKSVVINPDNSQKTVLPDGSEKVEYPDGTSVMVNKDGTREIQFGNGETEYHCSQYMKRTFNNGTVKYVYPNGNQETRYKSGRVRVKDKSGNLILDSIF